MAVALVLEILWITCGPKISSCFSCLLPATRPFIHVAGDRRFNRSPPSPELRLSGACGKERTGFPQVGGAFLSEIHHPVNPEIWKRCCAFS
jgi:hypothetical protein